MFFDQRSQAWLDIRLQTRRDEDGQVASSLVVVPAQADYGPVAGQHSGLPPSPAR
ncbi:hypothetical protein [Mycobacterium sp. DL440]|uniref:hypothetical protein n=1 Tax=Mycobacterium sp. DL440 TaxID=2675523 RepID=UPI0014242123|nr:hypothetical protein [Mycobacterium sp. DL440]